jgi:predicted dehydrogenase
MARKKVTRREFLTESGTAAAAAAFTAKGFPMIVPRHVLGGPGYQAPSDTVNFAVVGFGGMGSGNAHTLAGWHNLAAVCDVDMVFAQRNVDDKLRPRSDGSVNPDAIKLRDQFAKAAKYADWREMLEKEKGIDGVVIATPDHAHAVVANAAMKLGKHVYVQKPLAWSVHECRVLRATALANPKLATQMGNQGHSSEGARLVNEWIAAGVIGPVREVHVYTNRPVGYWPQGVPRPNSNAGANQNPAAGWSLGRINNTIAREMGNAPPNMPAGFRWDLYLGPVAEDIPYHPIYHPFNWRGWIEFGGGALGDMGAHLVNHAYWALGLTHPSSIEATSTAFGTAPVPPQDPTAPPNTPAGRMRSKPASFPLATTVHYQFPARGSMPPVKMTWVDGGLYPPRPDLLPDSEEMVAEGGVIFYGEKGILINDTYGLNPRLFPESLRSVAARVPKTMPRVVVPGLAEHMEQIAAKPQPNPAAPAQPPRAPDPDRHIGSAHALNWARAIKGLAKPSCPIEYAAQLTETMLLGVAALRSGQGRKVYYDGAKGEFTNAADANQYLTRVYRDGWAI